MLFFGLKNAAADVIVQTVQDSISTDTHWTADKQYLLKGYVYVTDGATLTIDAGVIVKGDKNTKGALVVERGAKIMAMGTASAPVVFTSNQAKGSRSYGDWGGVILCGKAPNNWNGGVAQVEGGPRSLYGGNDPHDNSGEMHYVRIEFAGIAFSPNNEVNGLTFCSVGDNTKIDHIQVSYSGDDSFEFFGGTVNTKYMVSLACWDDDFDTDNGYSGFNQYGMVLRDPFAADVSGSKSFESDSYQGGTATGLGGDTSGLTKAVFSNYTVVGPLNSPTSTAYDPQFVAGVHLRRGTSISIMNSVIVGYPVGVLVDESSSSYGSTVANIAADRLQFRNNAIAGVPVSGVLGNKEVFFVFDGARNNTQTTVWGDTATYSFAPYSGPFGWITTPSFQNKIYATEQSDLRLPNPFNLTNPNFVPTSTSAIVYNSTSLPSYISGDPFGNGKKYPYDGTKPINTDTSNQFANYNAPTLLPDFSSSKLSSSFFVHENHIGAFGYTATTADNWTAGWTNFDPNNTDYSTTYSGIADNEAGSLNLRVAPNPAHDKATLGYEVTNTDNVNIDLYNVTGQKVKSVFSAKQEPGKYVFQFDTDGLTSGLYIINVTTSTGTQSIRLSVVK